jgi:hypothetical protein
MLTEPLQEIFSRQDAKSAKKKIFFRFSELGVLCVPSTSLRACFARLISFPILQVNISLRISNIFG